MVGGKSMVIEEGSPPVVDNGIQRQLSQRIDKAIAVRPPCRRSRAAGVCTPTVPLFGVQGDDHLEVNTVLRSLFGLSDEVSLFPQRARGSRSARGSRMPSTLATRSRARCRFLTWRACPAGEGSAAGANQRSEGARSGE
jgi:hypothetical protein